MLLVVAPQVIVLASLFLLAEEPSPDWRVSLLLIIFTAVGSAGQYVFSEWRAARKEKSARSDAEEKTIIEHQEELIARIDKEKSEAVRDRDAAHEENRNLVEEKHRCQVSSTSMRLQIRYLERVLAQNGLSFEKYQEEATEPKESLKSPVSQSGDSNAK